MVFRSGAVLIVSIPDLCVLPYYKLQLKIDMNHNVMLLMTSNAAYSTQPHSEKSVTVDGFGLSLCLHCGVRYQNQ